MTMSVADCTSVPSLFSSKQNSVWTWLSFYFVQRIDILSPAVHEALQGHSRKKIMSLTPGGTYLVPPGLHKGVRKPTVCFLGRLVEQKGLEDLFDVLPSTWALLQLEVPPNFSFVIAGYGSLESYVKMKVLELARSHIPISFIGYADANELLAESTILLSLQEVTNYPSRVVAESLMAGCAVIVRDTGDSRKFGDDFPGLIYCEAKLDAKELAEQILNFLNRSAREFDFSASLRNTALIRFSSPSYIDYYRAILTGKSPTSDSLN